MSSVPTSHTSLLSIAPSDYSRLRRFTVAEYHAICKTGIFGDYEPTELIEGLLLRKHRPMTPRECFPQRAFVRLSLDRPDWFVTVCVAITLGDSEPEPDAAFVRGTIRDYDTRHPVASEIGMVVEFADASLEFDRSVKSRIYSDANISRYWIVNLVDSQIEVYTDPQPAASPPTYATRTDYRPGQDVPIVLDGQEVGTIPVSELLP